MDETETGTERIKNKYIYQMRGSCSLKCHLKASLVNSLIDHVSPGVLTDQPMQYSDYSGSIIRNFP